MEKHPIIWAIDPFQRNPKVWKRSKELALWAARALGRPLKPVYVMDRGFGPAQNAALAQENEKFRQSSKARLKRLLKSLGQVRVQEPEVLGAYGFNERNDAKELESYAAKTKSPMILAATEAHEGVRRLFEGSFVETLVGGSPIPVLLSNQHTRAVSKIEKIVFVSDLGPDSNQAFRKVCELARTAGARLEILSVQPDDALKGNIMTVEASGLGALAASALADIEQKRLRRAGARKARLGRGLGVETSFVLEDSKGLPVSEAILKSRSMKGADLLALSTTDAVASMHLLGSVTQDLIRRSSIPVWACHPSV
jgi:nucleotide-binding universal stress UspA family protein